MLYFYEQVIKVDVWLVAPPNLTMLHLEATPSHDALKKYSERQALPDSRKLSSHTMPSTQILSCNRPNITLLR